MKKELCRIRHFDAMGQEQFAAFIPCPCACGIYGVRRENGRGCGGLCLSGERRAPSVRNQGRSRTVQRSMATSPRRTKKAKRDQTIPSGAETEGGDFESPPHIVEVVPEEYTQEEEGLALENLLGMNWSEALVSGRERKKERNSEITWSDIWHVRRCRWEGPSRQPIKNFQISCSTMVVPHF